MESGRMLLARIPRQDDEGSAAYSQLTCDRFGGLVVAEIHIEYCNIAAAFTYQAERLGYRSRRADDFKTGICQLSGDIERDQGVVLDHQYALVQV